MAFPLNKLHLSLASVAKTTNAKGMEVSDTSTIYERDSEGRKLDKIIGYSITCSGYRGGLLVVKFPPSVEKKFKELQKELENDVEILISFSKLSLTAYALKGRDNNIISGVVGKAEDFTIISSIDSISSDLADMGEIEL
jgi:hypothetical protein